MNKEFFLLFVERLLQISYVLLLLLYAFIIFSFMIIYEKRLSQLPKREFIFVIAIILLIIAWGLFCKVLIYCLKELYKNV